MFISEYIKPKKALEDLGIFDALIDRDSNFFINIIRLKNSTVSEFVEAYQHLNSFFGEIATLLDAADAPEMSDKMYKSARKRFTFHEVNGINLGFSEASTGAGWGNKISDKVLADAYQIVKKGSKQPEIFHLVSLFEENVAGDRLSDMIATIIEPYIIKYTLRMMHELGVTPKTRKKLIFSEDGLIVNPYKRCPILMLPEEILHELPIAVDWDDIGRVASENDTIRREISAEIGAEWKKWASSAQKDYLLKHIFMQPDVCQRVIDGYKNESLDALDLRTDPDYYAALLLKAICDTESFSKKKRQPKSFDASMDIINIFKDWVENNRGWAEIQSAPSKSREKSIQRFMHLGAKHYLEINNLDSSFECDAGNGALDMKISRGSDKTVTEVKLSSNGQYLHGYETQIELYGKAERTEKTIYVFIDVGNPGRKKTIIERHRSDKRKGIKCPELVIIDARSRSSASTFKTSDLSLDFDFSNLDKINFDF
jgi:hypothetical protein